MWFESLWGKCGGPGYWNVESEISSRFITTKAVICSVTMRWDWCYWEAFRCECVTAVKRGIPGKEAFMLLFWMFTLTTFLKVELIYSSWWRWWQCSDRLNSSWHDALRLFDCSTISPQFVFPPSLIMFASLLLQLASPPDPASAAGQTATSSREKSWSSTWGRSRPRKANRCTAVWYVNKIQMSHNCLQSLLYSFILMLHWMFIQKIFHCQITSVEVL